MTLNGWHAPTERSALPINDNLELQYRGRLDESRMEPARPGAKRELFEAMTLVAETRKGPSHQMPSVGCSIKWK